MVEMSLTKAIETPSVSPIPEGSKEPRLVLTTQGRYSGRSEASLLSYRRYGDGFLVIASNEKRKSKPGWYLNLKEEPVVQVELCGASFYAMAITPTGRERLRLLPLVGEMMHHPDTSVPRETSAILLSPMC